MILPYTSNLQQYEKIKCPNCNENLHRKGTRKRHVRRSGAKHWFKVERFRCPCCGKNFTRLKPFMLPRKHYAADEIEESVSTSSSLAEESTSRRWRNEFLPKIQIWIAGTLTNFNLSASSLNIFQRLQETLSLMRENGLRAPPHKWPLLIQMYWYKLHPVCVGCPSETL